MTSILFIGDFGYGNKGQYLVSKLLEKLIEKYKCKFILGLGDNICPDGVKSINDKQFLDKFEIPYSNLSDNIKFFNILGQHDYNIKVSPRNEIKYTKVSNKWVMPHNFYCFRKKINNVPVEFIAIDTNLSKMKNRKLQEQWLLNTIYESRSRWIIVFGHHPWKSYSNKHEENYDLDELYTKINNIGKVDLILSGHEHNKQHIYIPDKPNMVICGVGSLEEENIKFYNNQELKFSSNTLGCGKIDFYKNTMNIYLYNVSGEKEYSFIINKI
jgi:tartrate-resistant acid phosphatase type 5